MECAPATWPTRTKSAIDRRLGLAGVSALLAAVLFAYVSWPTGWLGSDDAGYLAAAEHVLEGQQIQRVHHHYARAAVVVPVAISVAILGSTPAAAWIPSLAAALVCLVSIAAVGRMLWGWREGLLAALIVATIPYFRILATAGFPDAHVCMWTAASLTLAVGGAYRTTGDRRAWLFAAAGFCAAVATLTKVLNAPLIAAVLVFILTQPGWTRPRRLRLAAAFFGGGFIAIAAEGLFFWWTAGDFFFNYRVQLGVLNTAPTLGLSGFPSTDPLWSLVLDRLTLMFDPPTSGWGTLGVGFWIVGAVGLCFRTTRWLAGWSVATYLVLSLCPVPVEDGSLKLNPVFHGRHILPLCIPFALCAAYCATRAASLRRPVVLRGAASMAAVCVLVLAFADRHHLRGFVDRPTARLGTAIQRIVESNVLDRDGAAIFMTPSLYWRHHVLFPRRLRPRLAVCLSQEAPDWWRQTTCDMVERRADLPPPSLAYLIATPIQLAGNPEPWDYGVGLPRESLRPWHDIPPTTVVARLADRSIQAVPADHPSAERLLLVLGRVGEQTRSRVAHRP